jgi:hypothetical protein
MGNVDTLSGSWEGDSEESNESLGY